MSKLERRVSRVETMQTNLKRKVTDLAKRVRAMEPFAHKVDRDEMLAMLEPDLECPEFPAYCEQCRDKNGCPSRVRQLIGRPLE